MEDDHRHKHSRFHGWTYNAGGLRASVGSIEHDGSDEQEGWLEMTYIVLEGNLVVVRTNDKAEAIRIACDRADMWYGLKITPNRISVREYKDGFDAMEDDEYDYKEINWKA